MTSAVNAVAGRVHDGQAHAVDRDRVAVPGAVDDRRTAHREADAVAEVGERGHLSQLLHDAGEHSRQPSCRRAGGDAHVGAAPVVRRSMSRATPSASVADAGAGQRRHPGAEQGRRQVGHDPVDEPGPDERPGQRRAALEQHQRPRPCAQSSFSSAPRSTPPSGPAPSSAAVATQLGAASSSTRASRRRTPGVSTTTRSGCSPVEPRPDASRTVRCGSSARTVPTPAMIVSHSARSRCASRRDSGLEIQRLVPSAAATRPSRVAATFQTTNGRCQPYAGQPALVGALGLVREQPGLDVDARRPQQPRPRRPPAGSGRPRRRRRGRLRRPAAPRCTARSGRCARRARG